MKSYSRKKFIDTKYGINKEKKIKNVFEKHFNCNFKQLNHYNIFDYIATSMNKKIYIELKSRRNKKNDYPTTIVGYNKVKKSIKLIEEGYEIYFTFAFTDCVCYYRFENENPDWIRDGGRKDRGKNEIKSYYYIPVYELSDFE